MTPTETYYIAVVGSFVTNANASMNTEKQQIDLQTFYEEFLERSREARSSMLVRPVFRDEYFEVCYDFFESLSPEWKTCFTFLNWSVTFLYRQIKYQNSLLNLGNLLIPYFYI